MDNITIARREAALSRATSNKALQSTLNVVKDFEVRMVLPRGLNSNRVEQLQLVIKDWVEIYKSPPQLDGKTFQFHPLSTAA
jgi:hypothetical protein